MNQVTFSADKENLLFIVGDQMIKYPLREGVYVSFIEGQPVAFKPDAGSPEPAPQLQTSLSEGNKVIDLVLDNKNSKGYLVGDLDVVIGFQEPSGLAPEAKELHGSVRSFNFEITDSKVYIKRKDNDLSITLLKQTSTEINE